MKTTLMAVAALFTGAISAGASGTETTASPANRPEYASGQFLKSMNCSQAILETYAPSMGMPEEMARRVAAAFAGGMGMGAECGAVTGALMVIGLRYGKTEEKNKWADWRTSGKTADFLKEFRERCGAVGCSELLGIDMSTPEGLKEARAKGLFTSTCPKFVRSAAEILDKLLA